MSEKTASAEDLNQLTAKEKFPFPMPIPPPRNVHQRKLAVQLKMDKVVPDKVHFQKFKYISIQNLSNHLRQAMAEEGLSHNIGFTRDGRWLRIELINADEPTDREVSLWPVVPDDKGYAYSVKGPLMRLFLVGDGEEGDEAEMATKSGQAAFRTRATPRQEEVVPDHRPSSSEMGRRNDMSAGSGSMGDPGPANSDPLPPATLAEIPGPPLGPQPLSLTQLRTPDALKNAVCPQCEKVGTGFAKTDGTIACSVAKGGCGAATRPEQWDIQVEVG